MDQQQKVSAGINHWVFWPPFLVLLFGVGLNLLFPKAFLQIVQGAQSWIVSNFGWLFTIVSFLSFITCVWICFSKFGEVRIGGKDAKPLMSRWNWFSITICTTIAVGILLWATAEPLTHFYNPPANSGIAAKSTEAATFAMSTMFLHWTLTPYAMYAAASLAFAFAYYNMKSSYSLSAPLSPLIKGEGATWLGNFINGICLFALVAGMAATLGGGILVLTTGIHEVFPKIPADSILLQITVGALIIATFILSSATGLMKGIRILSSINTYALFVLAIFVFFVGPTNYLLDFGLESLGDYLANFFQKSFYSDAFAHVPEEDGTHRSSWSGSWTTFYWAVWLAWTPITACFLGQISYGRTVREFMMINFMFPSLFCGAWMVIFGGTAIYKELNGTVLFLDANGEQLNKEAIAFNFFHQLPLAWVLIKFYIISTFICFVTSADSNTTAMAAISSKNISLENSEGPLHCKVIWGVTVGAVALVMVCSSGVEGIKTIATIGGFPAAFLMVFVLASLFRMITNTKELNVIDALPQSSDK